MGLIHNQVVEKILDSITDGVLIIDQDYNIVYVNKATLKFCEGLSKEEVLGRKCHDISHQCSSPCPKQCLSDIVCPHAEGFGSGRSTSIVHTHIRPDGTERLFDITASPIMDDKGEVCCVIEVLRDVTDAEKTKNALLANEEFIRNILESMGEGLVVIDHDYRIIAVNTAYCRQVSMPCESVLGKRCYEISHHDEKPCFENGEECAAQRTFRTGEPHLVVHTHFDSQGEPVYVELKSYPMRNRAGNIVSVIEVISNITEKKKLEDQLRHAQKMEAVGTLTGGIAHDFNNILTAIIGYASILESQMKQNDPLLANVRQVLASAERAAGLTHSLLAFSRKQTINPKPVNLNEIIRGAEKLLTRLIKEDIEFETMLSAEDLPVMGDHGQIEQVLMNMATNARDAMPHGGKLTISTGVTELNKEFLMAHDNMKPGMYAMVIIADTGTGMDEKTREKIFEPFFTTKEVGKGTGLGLAMAYGIIKQHKGVITVSSELGRGTVFRVHLPLHRPLGQKAEEPPRPASAVRGGTETFLVAEDDETVRKIVTTVLAGAGYTVIEAANGEDAVRKFLENKDRIQALLFDVTMPKKNGFAAYEEIKRTNPGIKIVFMSGYTDGTAARNGAAEEKAAFVSKPVSPNELLKTVRKVLDA